MSALQKGVVNREGESCALPRKAQRDMLFIMTDNKAEMEQY